MAQTNARGGERNSIISILFGVIIMGVMVWSIIWTFPKCFFFANQLYQTPADLSWPPVDRAKSAVAVAFYSLPRLIGTAALLISVVLIFLSGRDLLNKKRLYRYLALAIVFAAIFLGLQIFLAAQTQFSFGGGLYGAKYFMFIGHHGTVSFLGVIYSFIAMIFVATGHIAVGREFGFRAVQLHWYYVAGMWIALMLLIALST